MRLRTFGMLGLLIILGSGHAESQEAPPFKSSPVIVGGGGLPDSVREAADHCDLVGIGIDEVTALCRQGDSWSVKGDSYGIGIAVEPDGDPSRIESYREGAPRIFATKGWPLNLKLRR